MPINPTRTLAVKRSSWLRENRLLGVEELRCDSGPRPVTGDPTPNVTLWHTRFPAEFREYISVQPSRHDPSHSIQEQEVDHLACLWVAQFWLMRTNLLPGVDRLPYYLVNGFRKCCSCLADWHI